MQNIEQNKSNISLMDYSKLEGKSKEKIDKLAVIDDLKDQSKAKLKADKVDLQHSIDLWLLTKQSNQTRTTYRIALNDLMEYCNDRGIKPLLLEASQADSFLLYLKERYKSNSVRLKISACSSFFSNLRRHRLVSFNPFQGSPLPRKEYKKSVKAAGEEISILSDGDIDRIESYLKSNLKGNEKAYLAIHFMKTYGLRVGSLPSIELHKTEGFFYFVSKGSRKNKINIETITLSLVGKSILPFQRMKPNTLAQHIKRLSKKLIEGKVIDKKFSAHDFRHYFAMKEYRANKDIYRLKELLDHSSLAVTDIYLNSVGVGAG